MKVFITGITGTLGKELLKRYYGKWEIVGFSRDELKQAMLEREYPKVKFIIGDVRDFDSVYKAMRGCDAVIHAAAMKRIEVCEQHPLEAVRTNVFGTENVARAATYLGIKKAITVGSDKGVDPVNAYGMTKALQEKIFTSYNYNSARYGNVFGSRGSVVPLFYQMAKEGKSLTVTDPTMTRFILTIDEAISLIIKALEEPMDGSVYVKKMPAASLGDIAKAFSDDITIIGKMRGEKLHETLISSEEFTRLAETKDGFAVIGTEKIRDDYGRAYTSDTERRLTPDEIREFSKKALGVEKDPAKIGL
ncbi:MAG: polysaccharide biosynthesis protein [Patescibacteria group bacterium]|nr:polysaccharide biosynthesis protein [Patescibacteria group bacterium]